MRSTATPRRSSGSAAPRCGPSSRGPTCCTASGCNGEGRRVDARRQLRAAHDLFAAMGAEAFAERARRELSTTGERVRRREVDARTELTAAGGAHRPAGPGRTHQSRDRREAVPQHPHHRMAPPQDIRQARDLLPEGARPRAEQSRSPHGTRGAAASELNAAKRGAPRRRCRARTTTSVSTLDGGTQNPIQVAMRPRSRFCKPRVNAGPDPTLRLGHVHRLAEDVVLGARMTSNARPAHEPREVLCGARPGQPTRLELAEDRRLPCGEAHVARQHELAARRADPPRDLCDRHEATCAQMVEQKCDRRLPGQLRCLRAVLGDAVRSTWEMK